MTEDTPDATNREERIDQVLAAYLEAERMGETPDRAALLARHPELAGELRSFFADRGSSPWAPTGPRASGTPNRARRSPR